MYRRLAAFIIVAVATFLGRAALAQITLAPGPERQVDLAPQFIAIADFNGDGFADTVVGDAGSNSLVVAFGQDGTSFGATFNIALTANVRGVVAGDVDGDHNADIVAITADGAVSLLLGRGDGTFASPVRVAVVANPIDVALGHFVRRGVTDVVIATTGSITAFINSGNGSFTPRSFGVRGAPVRVATADLNSDGLDDLVVLSTRADGDVLTALTNTGHGSFKTASESAVGEGGKDLAVADFNNDGIPDVAVLNAAETAIRNQFSISILLNRPASYCDTGTGTGVFDLAPPVPVACPPTLFGVAITCVPNAIAAGDDTDGFADFAVSFSTRAIDAPVSTAGFIAAFQGHGNGTFDFATEVSVGLDPQRLASADFNGDGTIDIGLTEQTSHSVRIVDAVWPEYLPDGICHAGRQCASGFCVDGVCCNVASCPADQRCDIPGSDHCAPPAPNGASCARTEHCASGFCVDGFCCGSRSCPAGQFCNSGACASPAANGVPCNEYEQCASQHCTDSFCCSSSHCPTGESCGIPGYVGACTGLVCTEDSQCQSGFCTDGACCATRVCLRGQSCSVLTAEGVYVCTTPATPLEAVASAVSAAAPVSLVAGSATGKPGDDVTIAVTLVSGGAQVAGVQADIAFASDTPIATNADGEPDCTVNPAIGKPSTAFAFGLTPCQGGLCRGVRAVVVSVTNIDPIPDGAVLFTCHLAIAAAAVGDTYPLLLTRIFASDPKGSSVPITGTDGAIVVVVPGATSRPTRTATPPPTPPVPATPSPIGRPTPCLGEQRCDIFGSKGDCADTLPAGFACEKDSDCALGLWCDFDSRAAAFVCSLAPEPTVTVEGPPGIPPPTAKTAAGTSLSGPPATGSGGCTMKLGRAAPAQSTERRGMIIVLAALGLLIWRRGD